jgi:hypothetical protein
MNNALVEAGDIWLLIFLDYSIISGLLEFIPFSPCLFKHQDQDVLVFLDVFRQNNAYHAN